jgi:Bacterial Ig domain
VVHKRVSLLKIKIEAASTAKPTAKDKDIETTMNQPVKITLEAIDPDPAKSLEYWKVTPPPNGEVDGFPSKTVTYTPKAGYSGEDRFQYRARRSGTQENSNTATVKIKIEAASTTPPPSDITPPTITKKRP